MDLQWMGEIEQPREVRRLPVALAADEVARTLAHMRSPIQKFQQLGAKANPAPKPAPAQSRQTDVAMPF